MECEGDPRRGGTALRPFKRVQLDLDQLPPDYTSLLSLMLGLLAFLLETPLCAWVSLVCLLSSLANLKRSTIDVKQIICTVTCVSLGLWVNYGTHSEAQCDT
jgi:hypothetical protein